MMIRTVLAAVMTQWISLGQTIPFETHYEFGHHIPASNSWAGHVALDLAPVAKGTSGKVWFRQTPEGILIFARIKGDPPLYARFPGEMATRHHVSLWLAASPDVEMPELGWGNQHGVTNCKQLPEPPPSSEESCQAWEARQMRYRQQLRRLFVRHWELAPGVTHENYASEAYRGLFPFMTNWDRQFFAKLEPGGGPLMDSSAGGDVSHFEILVRWSDFPPVNSLTLANIYIALDYCGPNRACSSATPRSKGGYPSTFHKLTLARPKVSVVSICGHKLLCSLPVRSFRPLPCTEVEASFLKVSK